MLTLEDLIHTLRCYRKPLCIAEQINTGKVLLSPAYLHGHVLGFHTQNQTFIPLYTT